MRTSFSWEGKGRYVLFHSRLNASVAGKTMWSLVNACHTWAPLWWGWPIKRRYIKCLLCATSEQHVRRSILRGGWAACMEWAAVQSTWHCTIADCIQCTPEDAFIFHLVWGHGTFVPWPPLLFQSTCHQVNSTPPSLSPKANPTLSPNPTPNQL